MGSFIVISQVSGASQLLEKKRFFTTSEVFFIGRGDDATIRIPSEERMVSRKHLMVSFDEAKGLLVLRNMGKIGTLINGQKIEDVIETVQTSNIVSIGNYSFEIEYEFAATSLHTEEYKIKAFEANNDQKGKARIPKNELPLKGVKKDAAGIKPIHIAMGIIGVLTVLLFLIPTSEDPVKVDQGVAQNSIHERVVLKDSYSPKQINRDIQQRKWTASERTDIITLFETANDNFLSNVPENRWKALRDWEKGFIKYQAYDKLPIDLSRCHAEYLEAVSTLNADLIKLQQQILIARETKNPNSLERSMAVLLRLVPDQQSQIFLVFKRRILSRGM